MQLEDYLKRIHYDGPLTPTERTLAALQHQHLLHIPYENIDVQQRCPLDFDIQRIFNKLVHDQRGGWCYEMNGLLGWALEQIGFTVTRLVGAVDRAKRGDEAWGNHLVLRVDLDAPYIVDVGIGDGLRYPVPFSTASFVQGDLPFSVESLTDTTWRVHNHPFSNVASFDLESTPADESVLANKCQWLQTDPTSPFRQVLIVQRFTEDAIYALIGRMLNQITPTGVQTKTLDSIDELHQVLQQRFGLTVDISNLWEGICATHEQMLQRKAQD